MSPNRKDDLIYDSEASLRMVSAELTALTAPNADAAAPDAKAEDVGAAWVMPTPLREEATIPRELPLDAPGALELVGSEVHAALELLRHALRVLENPAQAGTVGGSSPAQNAALLTSLSRQIEARLLTVQRLLDQFTLDVTKPRPRAAPR